MGRLNRFILSEEIRRLRLYSSDDLNRESDRLHLVELPDSEGLWWRYNTYTKTWMEYYVLWRGEELVTSYIGTIMPVRMLPGRYRWSKVKPEIKNGNPR